MKATLTDWLIAALAYIALCALFTIMSTDDDASETNTMQRQQSDISMWHRAPVTPDDKKALAHENQNSSIRR